MPDATELTVHILAAIAQHERSMISSRTKSALQAAKARGTKLGNPNSNAALLRAAKGNTAAVEAVKATADTYAGEIMPIIADIQAAGITSYKGIARELNSRGINTARRGQWYAATVRNLLTRLA